MIRISRRVTHTSNDAQQHACFVPQPAHACRTAANTATSTGMIFVLLMKSNVHRTDMKVHPGVVLQAKQNGSHRGAFPKTADF
jgi:hypothetical protein